MQGAMARDLSVNAVPETKDPADWFNSAPASKTGLGPCLYLGPAGQRCSRPALEGGFCALHQPNSSSAGTPAAPVSPRRVGVILTILALLWPILADVVREIIRLFR